MNETIRTSFVKQVGWCDRMGSALYAELVQAALDNLDAGGPVRDIVAGYEGDALSDALPLRFMGGIHRLVLDGKAPQLAGHFPTVGGTPYQPTLVKDFLDVVDDNTDYLIDAQQVAPQTNEIGRSAALLPGLAYALDNRSLQIRLLEIGSSAGLNLLADRYHYRSDHWTWEGSVDAPVITFDWAGSVPSFPERFEIVERRGCDLSPLDASDPEAQIRLLSFVWADQPGRFQRLKAALEMVQPGDVSLNKADAASWVEERVLEPTAPGVMTVLQHSVMWMYLSEESRSTILAAMEHAGARATNERPLAHVRFESAPEQYDAEGHRLTVTTWPDREERVLAWGHAHGTWVRWTQR
ncbi:MAG: DUF2332 domain-containing protein [Armatimonadetes bacterium]|nr:MAG: DUF2332 domain-containing protein [Armatimonadota bacterium]